MFTRIRAVLLGFVAISIFVFPLAGAAEVSLRSPAPRAARQVLVKLRSEQAPDHEFKQQYKVRSAEKIVKRYKFSERQRRKVEERGVNRLYTLEIATDRELERTIEQLNQDPRVEYAEPNYQVTTLLVPNDPSFAELWGLHNTGQTGGHDDADIDAVEAWESGQTASVAVGIIDTGVDFSHPDLAANRWNNPGEIAGNGQDDDHNGFVDDIYGWDFVNDDNDPTDDYGHGTHVAGTIGAVGNNGVGVAGVNWSVPMASLKFLGKNGSGYTDDAVRAIQYANLMDFKITTNSWGGGGYSQALFDAIAAANGEGFLFIAAAGNDSRKGANYPAAYSLPNIISVAASTPTDTLASFSNYSSSVVDLAAPGVSILSTVPTGSCQLCSPSGYAYLSGTSMATPHVAGSAALVWARNAALTNAAVKSTLFDGVDVLSSLAGKVVTSGRLNINVALNGPSPTPTPSPTPSASPSPSPTLSPTPAPLTVFSDSFEVAEWNNAWTEDVQNDWYRSRQRKVGTGRYSAEVDGQAVNAQLISNPINLQGRTSATIAFSWLIESGLDTGEYVAFDVSTDGGSTWVEKARLRGNQDPENSWRGVTINLSGINELRLRFRGTMSGSSEEANVDAVVVTAQ